MKEQKTKIIDIKDIDYNIEYYKSINNLQYAQIDIPRDRSSFAGIGFIVNSAKSTFKYQDIEEKLIKQVSKYDNLRIGMEEYYIKKVQNIFYSEEKDYGIEILFLIYSDVRSSEMIFSQLIKDIDTYIIENKY